MKTFVFRRGILNFLFVRLSLFVKGSGVSRASYLNFLPFSCYFAQLEGKLLSFRVRTEGTAYLRYDFVWRTVGHLKVPLLFFKQRLLFVLSLCGIIYLHGFAVRLFSVW